MVQFNGRYVSLHSPLFCALFGDNDDNVPTNAKEFRRQRDGHEFHCTLIAPFEMREIDMDMEAVMDVLEATVRADWTDLGLAKAADSDDGACAWFRLLQFPSADECRRRLGLAEHGFHVTIGFEPHDVHGIVKCRNHLIASSPQ
jgi:Swiss Army Knife, 2H phosphoesterase domain